MSKLAMPDQSATGLGTFFLFCPESIVRSSFSLYYLGHPAGGSLRCNMSWRQLRCSRSALQKFVEPV
jgi:hypothetical protein